MTKFYICAALIAGLALSSCKNKHNGEKATSLLSNFLSISDNEDKGVKEILAFYGGQCKYSIGYTTSTNNGKKKYFELEITKSELVEQFAEKPVLSGSNISYMFYRNLKEEKNNYDQIHTVIKLNNEKTYTFEYKKEDLQLVDEKMQLIEKVVDLLKNKKFEAFKSVLKPDSSVVKFDQNEYFERLASVDHEYGDIKEFRPLGFRFDKFENGTRRILHIAGVLIRDKQNSEFSVDIDPTSTKDEVLLMRYEL